MLQDFATVGKSSLCIGIKREMWYVIEVIFHFWPCIQPGHKFHN